MVNFITCGCESSAPFFVIYKAGTNPHTKTGRHDIAEILLKVALKTKNQSNHKYIKMEVRIHCEQAIYNIHDYVEGTSVLIGYSPNYIL
jgi:hypothetical protein